MSDEALSGISNSLDSNLHRNEGMAWQAGIFSIFPGFGRPKCSWNQLKRRFFADRVERSIFAHA